MRAVSLNQFRLRFGENINRPAALDIETSLVGDNTDRAWGERVGPPDLPETILFEDIDPVHHDSIVWGWSSPMRTNLWPTGTISGNCTVRYSGLRSGAYKQGSNECYEKNDSGSHVGIVIAVMPGVQPTILLRFARRRPTRQICDFSVHHGRGLSAHKASALQLRDITVCES